MKIMHTVFSFTSGGIENLLVDTINNWDNKNDTVYLCIINNDINQNLLERIKKHENIKIIRMNRKIGGNKLGLMLLFPLIVKKYKIDIIHCHSFSAYKVSAIAKIINNKVKLVYTVHDMRIFPRFSRIERLFVNFFVDKLIAISQSVKQDILSGFPHEDMIQVIYNGVDFSKFLPNSKQHGKSIRIGNVARIIPEKKGQDVLIRAIAIVKRQYPDVVCFFAGEPIKEHPEYLDQLRALSNELGLTQNIKFVGNCEDIPTFLNEIDIFVLPSRYEGFGIAVIEAIAAKKPVITSDLEGPKEILSENKMGEMFSVGNEKDLANLILKEIQCPSSSRLEEIYQYALQKYSINSVISTMRSMYMGL